MQKTFKVLNCDIHVLSKTTECLFFKSVLNLQIVEGTIKYYFLNNYSQVLF